MNWRPISKRYPLAVQAYNGYVSNIAATRAYARFIRAGHTMADLPWEMQEGVVLGFLEQHGYLIGKDFNTGGFARMRLFERRSSGRHIVFHTLNNDDRNGPVQHNILLQQAVLCCLKRIEDKARKALEPPAEQYEPESEFIGVDISGLGVGDES